MQRWWSWTRKTLRRALFSSPRHHRQHRIDKKRSSSSSRSAKSDESPSNYASDCHWNHKGSWGLSQSKKHGPKVLCSVNNRFLAALDYQNFGLAEKSSKYDDRVAKIVAKVGKRLQVHMKTNTFHSFGSISTINKWIFGNVQSCLWYKFSPGKCCHGNTIPLPEEAGGCRLKLANSAIVKVGQTPVERDAGQLKQSNQLPPGSSRTRRSYRWNGRWNPTIHTAVNEDADKVRRGSVEPGPPLGAHLRWICSEWNIYWRTARSHPMWHVFIHQLKEERYCSGLNTPFAGVDSLAAWIAFETKPIYHKKVEQPSWKKKTEERRNNLQQSPISSNEQHQVPPQRHCWGRTASNGPLVPQVGSQWPTGLFIDKICWQGPILPHVSEHNILSTNLPLGAWGAPRADYHQKPLNVRTPVLSTNLAKQIVVMKL